MVETVGGQSRPGIRGGVLVTPRGEVVGSTTPEVFRGEPERAKLRGSPEELEISRLRKRIEGNLSDVQGTRSADEKKIRELQEEVSKKQSALERAREAKKQGKATASQLTSISAAELRERRQRAGTFGRDVGRAREIGILKRLPDKEDSERVQRATTSQVQGKDFFGKIEKSFENLPQRLEELRNRPGAKPKVVRAATGIGASAAGTVLFARDLIKSPLGTTKETAKAIEDIIKSPVTTAKKVGGKAKQDPFFFGGFVAGEVLQGVVGGKAIKSTQPVGNFLLEKVTPASKKVIVDPASGLKYIKIPSKIEGQSDLVIPLAEGIPRESIASQIKLAGKEQKLVTSGARDLFGVLDRAKIVKKKIPNEAKLTKETKELLNLFDRGELPVNKISELNKRIVLETSEIRIKDGKVNVVPGAKGIQERFFFADPKGRLRPSRLGIKQEKEATLGDILKGDFTFRKGKPQAIVFEKQSIAKFPKELSDVKQALLKGKDLTDEQFSRLIEFQRKPSGLFKPLGFTTKESEIVLGTGEIISKKGSVTRLINGKRVKVITAEVKQATKETKELLNKLRKNDLSSEELKRLENNLVRESGFSRSEVSSYLKEKPVLSKSKALSKTSSFKRLSSKIKSPTSLSKSVKSPTKSSGKLSKPSSTPKSTLSVKSPTSIFKPSPPIFPKVVKSILSPPKKIKPLERKPGKLRDKIRPIGKRLEKISKSKGYNVFYKRRNKLIKVTKTPVTKLQALDLGADIADRTLANTFKIRPTKRKPKTPEFNIKKGYFQRTQKKYRDFRIVKGRKVPLKNTYIEKRGKPRLDTITERRKLQAAAYVARLKKGVGVKVKKKPVFKRL